MPLPSDPGGVVVNDGRKQGKFPRGQNRQFLMPRDVVCEILGVSRSTLDGWMSEKNPPPTDDKGYFPAKDLGNWIRNEQIFKETSTGKMRFMPKGAVALKEYGEGEDGPDYNRERARVEQAKRVKMELDNEIRAGEFVSAEDVIKGWQGILMTVKTRIMKVPHIAARIVTGDDDMVSVQKKIDEVVRDALTELSTGVDDA